MVSNTQGHTHGSRTVRKPKPQRRVYAYIWSAHTQAQTHKSVTEQRKYLTAVVSLKDMKSACVHSCVSAKRGFFRLSLGKGLWKQGNQKGSATGSREQVSEGTAVLKGPCTGINLAVAAHRNRPKHTCGCKGLIGSADKSQAGGNHPGGTAFISIGPARQVPLAAFVCAEKHRHKTAHEQQ